MQRKSCLLLLFLSLFIINTVFSSVFSSVSNKIDSLELCLQEKEGLPQMEIMVEIASLYVDLDPAKSFKYASEVMKWAKENKNRDKEADAMFIRGKVYKIQADYDQSLNYHFSALKIFEELNDSNQIIEVINSIGRIYMKSGEFDKSLEYFDISYAFWLKDNNEKKITAALNSFGVVYSIKGELDVSMDYYKKALERTLKEGNPLYIGKCFNNIGYNYYALGDFENAILYFNKALKEHEKADNKVDIARAWTNIASIYYYLKDYKKAELCFLRSNKISEEHFFNAISLRNYDGLYSVYDSIGNIHKAFNNLLKYSNLKDSMFNAEKHKQLYELEKIYLVEKKEKELEKVRLELSEEKAVSQKQMIQKYALVGGLFFILLFLILSFRNYKEKVKAGEIKQKLLTTELENNKLKEQYLAKELTDFALHIVQRNELLKNIKKLVQKIKTNLGKDKNIDNVTTLMNLVNYYININKEKEELQSRVDKVNQDFIINLERKHPKLTSKERWLCCLLRLNLSSKEIADLLNLSSVSIDNYRCNLRRKFNLSADDKLSEFLEEL